MQCSRVLVVLAVLGSAAGFAHRGLPARRVVAHRGSLSRVLLQAEPDDAEPAAEVAPAPEPQGDEPKAPVLPFGLGNLGSILKTAPPASASAGSEIEADEDEGAAKSSGTGGFDLVDGFTIVFGLSILLSFGGVKLFGDAQPW